MKIRSKQFPQNTAVSAENCLFQQKIITPPSASFSSIHYLICYVSSSISIISPSVHTYVCLCFILFPSAYSPAFILFTIQLNLFIQLHLSYLVLHSYFTHLSLSLSDNPQKRLPGNRVATRKFGDSSKVSPQSCHNSKVK